MFVVQVIVQQLLLRVLATVTLVLVLVPHIIVQQLKRHVLVTVTPVLVQVQHIAVQQVLAYVLAIVMSVLVLVPHIAVQQVMLSVLTQLPLVTVQAVVQCLIVSHVLLVKIVQVIVVTMSRPVLPAMDAQPHTIGVMEMAPALPHKQRSVQLRP